MTVQQPDQIDIVAEAPDSETLVLIMVEDRPWGERGELLSDLQAKFLTYLRFVRHHAMPPKPVQIQLVAKYPWGELEQRFLDSLVSQCLSPEGISFVCRIGELA